MGHLDKRLESDKDADRNQGGRIKDGVSGTPPASNAYEENKTEDLNHGAAPDVVRKEGEAASGRPDRK